jgi:hypothetical protein
MLDEKFIVITGHLQEGFTFTGPFDEIEEAEKYAKEKFPNEQWSIGDILPTHVWETDCCGVCDED